MGWQLEIRKDQNITKIIVREKSQPELKQAGTCISCEDLSVYKSDKKSNKNKVNDNLL